MSFSDPQSVTVAGTTYSLPRIVTLPTASTFQDATSVMKLDVSQQNGKINRSLARVDLKKISTDPLTDIKLSLTASAYIVIQRPAVGFSATELKDLVVGLTTYLTASSNANLLKLVGGEA